jgi:tetratricopeptide (TPR) repeat protein
MGGGSLRWVLALTLLIAQGCAPPERQSRQGSTQPVVAPLTQKETRALLDSNQFAELDRRFSAMQRGYRAGSITDEDLRAAFRAFYPTDAALEQKYTAWIAQSPKSYVARLARGIYYKKVGMGKRGSDSISNTTEEQLRDMEAAFSRASGDLRASLSLDDKPLLTYAQEMDIASYLGQNERIREILEAAIKVDPANIIVREKYMGTLEPRWGGSVEAMHAFLEESKQGGLSAAHLHSLEGIIFEDQAHTEKEAGDYAAAERDYRLAVAVGNEDCLPCFAEVLTHVGKFADAIPIYSKSLASNPDDADTLANRSYAYMQTGMAREGIKDLQAAAEAGNAYAQCELGRYYMEGIPGILSPDRTAGMDWFRKSASQGYPAGQENLKRALKLFGPQPAPSEAATRS